MNKLMILFFSLAFLCVFWDWHSRKGATPEQKIKRIDELLTTPGASEEKIQELEALMLDKDVREKEQEGLREKIRKTEKEIAGRPLDKSTAVLYRSLMSDYISLDKNNCRKYMEMMKEIADYDYIVRSSLSECYDFFGNRRQAVLEMQAFDAAFNAEFPYFLPSDIARDICFKYLNPLSYKSYSPAEREKIDTELKDVCGPASEIKNWIAPD